MKLVDALRALRDEGDAPGPSPDGARERIVERLERDRRRRARRPYWAVPLVAVLGAATASGALSGRWSHAWRSVAVAWRAAPVASASKGALGKGPSEPESAVPSLQVVAGEGTSAEATAVLPHVPRAVPSARVPARPLASSVEPSARPDSLALYRDAHRLHFTTRDPAAALSAWNDYLRVDPHGAFELEARYNRAVCLVRLGRFAEAREALEPLTAFGGYRANDARALLDAIDAQGGETKIE